MTWLLRLYPPRWRRRYGAELDDLVAAQPFSLSGAIDLIAGAIDAWIHPEFVPPASDSKDVPVIAQLMQLKCAGYGPGITHADRVKHTTINLAGTLALALAWLAMVWFWKHQQLGGKTYLMALAPMTYLVPFLIGLRYTSLKGRSLRSQSILIGGLTAGLVALLMFAGWLSTQI
jgi:hypothetical protein